MPSETIERSGTLTAHVRTILLELARQEDDLAARDAAAQPYWLTCPPSVQGHRAAAVALRDEADRVTAVVTCVAARWGEGSR